MRIKKTPFLAIIGVTATLILSGCGGSGSAAVDSSDPGSSNPSSGEIQGVATPSSVSVVTATNAN